MRARALVAVLVAMAAAGIAGPASAKIDIAKGTIAGPGLEHTLRIGARDAYDLWDSGIDMEGGLDEPPAESLGELGLTPADLGPRYLVTYWLGFGRARQNLYPYATGGPVAYSPPGQMLGRGQDAPSFLRNSPIEAGWYQSGPEFFPYLVDHGLSKANPVPALAPRESAPHAAPSPRSVPWARVVLALLELAAL